MADKITQQLGIDADQALQALGALDAGFQSFEKRLESVGQKMGLFNRQGRETVDGFKRAGRGAKTAADGIDRAGKAARDTNKDVKSLTISWETFTRVVVTQAIVRALTAIRTKLRESVTEAFELERLVRAVGTIDPRVTEQLDAGLPTADSLRAIRHEVAGLSSAFAISQLDVAEGLYQSISNQIARTGTAADRAATTVEFLTTSLKFARTALVSAKDSANLLAGVINSFGLEAEDADILAAKFFKTMELGRTTGAELARSFGTVDNIAEKLGVSFDELSAAFATVTISGVDTAKAATQLRGIFNAFLKPTTRMTAILKELGVANGEQLIEMRGLAGAIEAVIAKTSGASDEISELFPRVRGLTAVLRFASKEGAEVFADGLEQIRNTSAELLDQKFEFSIDSDAFRVQQDLQKLNNFLVEDFGNTFISTTQRVLELGGGVDQVINTVDGLFGTAKVLLPVLTPIGLGLAGISLQARLAAGNVTLLGKAVSSLAAIGAAATIGSAIGAEINQGLFEFEGLRKLERANAKALAEQAAALAKQNQQREEADRKRLAAAAEVAAKIRARLFREVSDLQQADAAIVRSTRKTLDEIVSARQDAIVELATAAKQSEDIIRESQNRVRGLRRGQEEARFRASLSGLDDSAKSFRLAQRAQQITRKASADLRTAVTPDDVQAALGQFERARELAREAAQLGEGNRASEFNAAKALDQITDNQIRAEQQLQKLQEQQIPAIVQERKERERILEIVKEQVDILKQNLSAFQGDEPLSDLERRRQLERRERARQALAGLGVDVGLDFEEVNRQLDEISRRREQLSFLDDLRQANEEAVRLNKQITQATTASSTAQDLKEEINQIFGEIQGAIGLDNLARALVGDPIQKELGVITQEIEKLSNDATLTRDEIDALVARRNQIGPEALSTASGRISFGPEIALIDKALNKLFELQRAQEKATELPGLREQLQQVQTNAAGAEQRLNNAAAALHRMRQDAEATANALARTPPAATSQFGRAFFQHGGRGVDTIPAMLSRGETVINPRSSRQFFSQLQAINAGQQPVFRQDGGSVTNIGDINVNMTSAGNAQVDAREVARSLRRELRRKTSRI